MNTWIQALIDYALRHKLIQKADEMYIRNQILSFLKQPEFISENIPEYDLATILNELKADLNIQKQIESYESEEIWESQLMNILVDRPSTIQAKFKAYYNQDTNQATDYFYELSKASNYIKVDRMKLDKKWTVDTQYGKLEITINLAKPEKDPKLIALAAKQASSSYPKCLLCVENEGYRGTLTHPARSQHRVIPIKLNGETFYLQYSPYVYYNEHCIIFHEQHKNMKINHATLHALLDFVDQFPQYFIGSNADLPIVGGSILSHEHYQGGKHIFAMNQAPMLDSYQVKDSQVTFGRVFWPLSCVRIKGIHKSEVLKFSEYVMDTWKQYSDESVDILAYTKETPHNTITPIVRKEGEEYVVDVVLRNNRTSTTYPDGIFHPHPQWHAIKKENIGLIEVMGLAILPARLLKDLQAIESCLTTNTSELPEHLQNYQSWYTNIQTRWNQEAAVEVFVEQEVGKVFLHVLEDAGVFKQTPTGQQAFLKFIQTIGGSNETTSI